MNPTRNKTIDLRGYHLGYAQEVLDADLPRRAKAYAAHTLRIQAQLPIENAKDKQRMYAAVVQAYKRLGSIKATAHKCHMHFNDTKGLLIKAGLIGGKK